MSSKLFNFITFKIFLKFCYKLILNFKFLEVILFIININYKVNLMSKNHFSFKKAPIARLNLRENRGFY